jgi:basic membrane protein A
MREEQGMRGVRGVRVGALLVALGLVAAACGGGDEGGDAGGGGGTAEAKKVGLVYDIGGRGDQSFNDSAGAGLDAAKQEQGDKVEIKEIEPNADGSNRKELLDSLAEEGYGLVIGVGFLFSEDIAKSASEAPETTFAVVDGFADACTQPDSNLLCLGFKEEEGSFLVGAAAALKTKSNTVGFVGGLEGDLIRKFQAGYEAGVQHIAEQEGKDIEVVVDYAGNTPEAFRDPAKGRELALKQIGQGADVIYHASGGTGTGVIAAAASKQVYAIGVDSDQSLTAEPAQREWILTSMLKRVDNAVQQTIASYVGGTLKGGIQTFGLKEGGIDYAQNDYNKELLGDIPTTLDDLKAKISSGEIKVPDKPQA